MTMILLLIRIIKQVANEARILAEANATLFALFLHLLPRVALGADEFRESFTIKVMRFILIVAETTFVKLVATWCHKHGASLIMRATESQ